MGTCNIDKYDNRLKSKNEIIIDNKKEIQKDINNYTVGVKRIVIHVGTYLDENYNYDVEKSIEYNIKYLEPFVEKAVENSILVAIENGTQMEKDDPQFKNTAPYIDELLIIVDYYNNK